jgi:hypothetical protein
MEKVHGCRIHDIVDGRVYEIETREICRPEGRNG